MASDHGNNNNNNNKPMEYVRKSTPPPFLLKTYMLVEDLATDEVVSWNADGTGFVVWQPAEFARDLLPTLFKHSNFSSFVRQLNTYGFRKVATRRWEFCNNMFLKGKRELLCNIRRRKAWSNNNKQQRAAATTIQVMTRSPHHDCSDNEHEHEKSSSTSSSSGHNTLMDENKRLRKENGVLSSELTGMKRKCKELLDLVAKYAQFEKKKEKDEDANDDDHHHAPLKLFGVRLEVEGERGKKIRSRAAEIIRESASSILVSQSCK